MVCELYPLLQEILCNNQLVFWHHGEGINQFSISSWHSLTSYFFSRTQHINTQFSFPYLHYTILFQKISKKKERDEKDKITLFSNVSLLLMYYLIPRNDTRVSAHFSTVQAGYQTNLTSVLVTSGTSVIASCTGLSKGQPGRPSFNQRVISFQVQALFLSNNFINQT